MFRLRTVNSVLLGLIILVNGYVILMPLLPVLTYNLRQHSGQMAQLQQALHPAKRPVAAQPIAQPNHVIIPSMLLNTPLYDGPVKDQYRILDRGIWRYPLASTPDKGGNTVLIGHRFTYTNPKGIFYYLNKVKLNDEIGLWWNNREYLYRVDQISVVPPTDTNIEAATAKTQLTLFTCTPLWWPKNRLVVIARPELSG